MPHIFKHPFSARCHFWSLFPFLINLLLANIFLVKKSRRSFSSVRNPLPVTKSLDWKVVRTLVSTISLKAKHLNSIKCVQKASSDVKYWRSFSKNATCWARFSLMCILSGKYTLTQSGLKVLFHIVVSIYATSDNTLVIQTHELFSTLLSEYIKLVTKTQWFRLKSSFDIVVGIYNTSNKFTKKLKESY